MEHLNKDRTKAPVMSTTTIKSDYLDDRKDPLRIHFRDVLYRNENGEPDRDGFKDRVGEGTLLVSFQLIQWSSDCDDVYVGCTSCVLPLNGQRQPSDEEVKKLQIGSTFLHSSLMPLSKKERTVLTTEATSGGTVAECETGGSEQVRRLLCVHFAFVHSDPTRLITHVIHVPYVYFLP